MSISKVCPQGRTHGRTCLSCSAQVLCTHCHGSCRYASRPVDLQNLVCPMGHLRVLCGSCAHVWLVLVFRFTIRLHPERYNRPIIQQRLPCLNAFSMHKRNELCRRTPHHLICPDIMHQVRRNGAHEWQNLAHASDHISATLAPEASLPASKCSGLPPTSRYTVQQQRLPTHAVTSRFDRRSYLCTPLMLQHQRRNT